MRKKTALAILFVLLSLSVCTAEGSGRDYGENNTRFLYVSTLGSDEEGDGSAQAPFATLGRAAEEASPGTTVRMAAGVYELAEIAVIPEGVSVEGAVPCGDCGGVPSEEMTVLTSETLTEEFTDRLLLLRSEQGPGGEIADGDQHISNLFLAGNGAAAQAIEIRNRSGVSVHDCAVVGFARYGVGWAIDGLPGDDGTPVPGDPPAYWAEDCRFVSNYMRDNSYYGGDAWGSVYGRGALFCCGLKDFEICGNTIIEDCRTAPPDENGARIRGIPVKFWYFNSWMVGCHIHDNTIAKLGSTVNSADSDGWDFAIESCSHAGLEIDHNRFIGAIDLNSGLAGTYGGTEYGFAAMIHDNEFIADPDEKAGGVDHEEWAIVLERIQQKTVIERNTVRDYNTFVYFNVRDSITDVRISDNVCTGMCPDGGAWIRLDGLEQEGARSPMTVRGLAITGNTLETRGADGAGFAVFLGQQMDAWTADGIAIEGNTLLGCGYDAAVHIGNHDTLLSAANVSVCDNTVTGVPLLCDLRYPESADAAIAGNTLTAD